MDGNKTLRVYFNAHADKPFIWSIDDGNPANEQLCTEICINVFMKTGYAQDAVPSAWIEGEGVAYRDCAGRVSIYSKEIVTKDWRLFG